MKKVLKGWLKDIAIAVILALFIRTFIVQAFKIPSGSMIPTLLIGDHILVCKFYYKLFKPKRGDIIVFKYPQDTHKDFIKRVIGLPGEVIMIKNKKVYINGKPLDEPYVVYSKNPSFYLPMRDNFGPVKIPKDSYFMMGDNRDKSLDSRFWGFLPKDLILGKALIIYWSWDPKNHRVRWGRIGKIIH